MRAWLARQPRVSPALHADLCSWLNQVERWFALITQAIRRGSFRNVRELIHRIDRFVKSYNRTSRPFRWTATADSILDKIQRLTQSNFRDNTLGLRIEFEPRGLQCEERSSCHARAALRSGRGAQYQPAIHVPRTTRSRSARSVFVRRRSIVDVHMPPRTARRMLSTFQMKSTSILTGDVIDRHPRVLECLERHEHRIGHWFHPIN